MDGSYTCDNFGVQNLKAVKHTTEIDPTMHLIKFDRGEGNKPVLMMNWRAHATITGGASKGDFSADFIGSKGYMPSALAWEYSCYETDSTHFEPDTAEVVQNHWLDMLNALKGAE